AVLTKSGQVPVNAAKQSPYRAAASVSAARHVNTAASRPNVNNALPIRYSYFKAHSPGNPQYTLQDQGIFDNRCFRHMTGNKSYLTDYQEINGGFVAFGGNAKGGKITGKGKIRTGKLDFEDVYFVKELKFNLFSVSQMYDKKNNVLFTDTKCVVLSPDFKLLDESQVLLKVPRKNNIYSFDLKNVVPVGGYSINSKAFRVFNTKTRFIEENLHINFLENKPNVAGTGPNWMFDIDTLTMSMNYQPVFAGNQTNGSKSSEDEVADDAEKKSTEVPRKENEVQDPAKEGDKNNQENDLKDQEEALRKQFKQESKRLFSQEEAANTNSTNRLNIISSPVNDVSSSFTITDPGRERAQRNEFEKPKKVNQALIDPSWIEAMQAELLLFRLQKVDDINFGSTKKSLCIEFEGLMHKKFQMSSMGELTFFLGLQVMQRDDGIFISQDKYMADILKKFNFSSVKTASTLIKTNKAFLKDEEAEDMDVYLYRSMIGSLMYLTASRLDIIFVVCACARFQVTPKVLHLHAMKRIFRYLKDGISDEFGVKTDSCKTANDEIQVSVVGLAYYCIMASAIICLAINQNFNFSKYIFDNMVKHLDGGVNFLMFSRFVQVFLDNQVEGKDFSGKVTSLFQSMMVQALEDMGEGERKPRNDKIGSKPDKNGKRKDSYLKDSIDQMDLANFDDYFVDPTPEMFNDEHAPDYSFSPRFDVYDDDFLEIESDADNFYDDPFDSKGEKIKESELLIDELDLPCDFLPYSEYDSFSSYDFFRDDDLPSPDNEDKVFSPGILIQEKSITIITRVAQEKKLAISFASLVFVAFDHLFYEPIVFKDIPNSMRL
nr:uncharacterized mitochondrial protein AtMg00810-like [Tanacetum cinerariifolium]